MNWELPDVQAGFRKGRGTRDQIASICWIIEKAKEFQRDIYFCFIDYAKTFDYVDHKKLWKILKEMGMQATLPASWEICVQLKKQPLELDTEQRTGSKLGKEYIKAVYCHPDYLTYMLSTSWKTLGWMKHKPESRLLGEISITSDMQMTPPLWQKVKRTKEPLDESETGQLKLAQNSTFRKWRSWHHFMANRWGNSGKSDRLYFLCLQNHCRWWLQPWN